MTVQIAKRLFNVSEYHRMAEAGVLSEDDPVELIQGEIIEKTSRGVAKRLFDVNEYHQLAQAGILAEDDRVELINGEIVEMSPINSPHASCVSRLDDLLHEQVGRKAQMRVQNPIQLDDLSEPQPDLALVKPRKDHYAHAHPRPQDVLLVIEVADTSLEYDRLVKIPTYARAGIPEPWLVDLNREVIGAFDHPVNGACQSYREFHRSEMITSKTIPELTLAVDDILG